MRCKHERTRCIHGDEGWARMKVYVLRWWKGTVVRRQACLDCGAALDRPPLCTTTGRCVFPPAQCRGGIPSLSPPLERCTLPEGHEGECQ